MPVERGGKGGLVNGVGPLGVEELERSPLASALFVLAGQLGLAPEEVARPRTALELAAVARRALDPWSGHAPGARAEVRDRFGGVRDLAAAVLADERTSWWDRSLSPEQLFMASSSDGRLGVGVPESPTSPWSRYAQRPQRWTMTSTPVGSSSPLHAVLAAQVGDWEPRYPVVPTLVRVTDAARVHEIRTAEDWHRLCTRYPALSDGRSDPEGLASDIAPDWATVAADWDVVHLTFAGLLRASYVPAGPAGSRTVLWTWDFEAALWLHEAFDGRRNLAPLERAPRLELGPPGLALDAAEASPGAGHLRTGGRRRWFRR